MVLLPSPIFLFQTGCAACHTPGDGDTIGPDVLGVTARRDRAWLTRMIQSMRIPDRARPLG